MSENVTELTNGKFDEFIQKGLVLVDFYAEWCMPCVMMEPVIDEAGEKFQGKVKFGKVNIEDNSELAQKFRVSSIPNLVLFKDGKVIEQFVGSMTAEDLDEKLNKHLK